MPDLSCIENKSLKYLLKIYECGSISAAADALYLSQPALTKYLKNLEDRLGLRLFNRYGRKLVPTWEGEQLIDYAKEISAIERRLANDVTNMENARKGRIRIALPVFRSGHILPEIIPDFVSKYPDVELEIVESSSQSFDSLLLEGKADFAFVNKISPLPEIETEVTREYEFYIVKARAEGDAVYDENGEYPYADIIDYRDESFILQTPKQLTRQYADYIFKEAGFEPKLLFTLSNIEAAAMVCASGCGVCFVPGTHLYRLEVLDRLTCRRLRASAPALQFGIAYLKGMYMPEYFRYFLSLARKI